MIIEIMVMIETMFMMIDIFVSEPDDHLEVNENQLIQSETFILWYFV